MSDSAHPAVCLLPLLTSRAAVLDTLVDRVHCMDWRALMDRLPAQSVDAIITDLPYGTTACDWDTLIDLVLWWVMVKRVLKPGGVMVSTASQPFASVLTCSNLDWFGYQWVWEKTRPTGFLDANRKPLRSHECILVFYQRLGIYNPQNLIRIAPTKTGNHNKLGSNYGGGVPPADYSQLYTNFPRDVQAFASVSNPIHPTQKPVALFEYLIRTYTNVGALVLDPFCGSGTTAMAARNTQRHFIVGDLSADYAEQARNRLAAPYTVPMFADVA